jgi:uncharacterized membrane protein YhaH (DUF805 family)
MDNSYTSNAFLFSFEGRINRAKYWYALCASMISCLVRLVFLVFLMFALNGPNQFGPDPQAPVNRSPRPAPNWDHLRELEFVRRGAGPSPGGHVKRGHD